MKIKICKETNKYNDIIYWAYNMDRGIPEPLCCAYSQEECERHARNIANRKSEKVGEINV